MFFVSLVNLLERPPMVGKGRGLCAGMRFEKRQAPELKPIEKLNYKITTKSPTEFRRLDMG